MSTCNQLDLQTLGSQLVIMPKNLPDHCLGKLIYRPFILEECREIYLK